MTANNILFLIIGFLAGMLSAMPLVLWGAKKFIAQISYYVADRTNQNTVAPAFLEIKTFVAEAKIEMSKTRTEILQDAVGIFNYLSSLITKDSILKSPPDIVATRPAGRAWAKGVVESERQARQAKLDGDVIDGEYYGFDLTHFNNRNDIALWESGKDSLIISQAQFNLTEEKLKLIATHPTFKNLNENDVIYLTRKISNGVVKYIITLKPTNNLHESLSKDLNSVAKFLAKVYGSGTLITDEKTMQEKLEQFRLTEI